MSLKRELENPGSPLRQFFSAALPGLATAMRSEWRPRLVGIDPISAAPGLPADVLGHAISARICWAHAALTPTPGTFPAGSRILELTGVATPVLTGLAAAVAAPCGQLAPDRAARLACLVGLADRAYRTGRADEPWYQPLLSARDLDEAMLAIPGAWVDDVAAVATRALSALAPLTGAATTLAPVFAGSLAVGGADGDLVLGEHLIEVKATRSAELRLRDLQQTVAYALLDWDDTHRIDTVAILAARFGVLVCWKLDKLLAAAGGTDLRQARKQLCSTLNARTKRGTASDVML